MQSGSLPLPQQKDTSQLYSATPVTKQVGRSLQAMVGCGAYCVPATYTQNCRTTCCGILQAVDAPSVILSGNPVPRAQCAGRSEVVITSALAASQVHIHGGVPLPTGLLIYAACFNCNNKQLSRAFDGINLPPSRDAWILCGMQAVPARPSAEVMDMDSNETRPLSQHVAAARYTSRHSKSRDACCPNFPSNGVPNGAPNKASWHHACADGQTWGGRRSRSRSIAAETHAWLGAAPRSCESAFRHPHLLRRILQGTLSAADTVRW